MAHDFDGGTDSLTNTTDPTAGATTLSLAAWVYWDAYSAVKTPLHVTHDVNGRAGYGLDRSVSGGDVAACWYNYDGSTYEEATAGALSTGAWLHMGGSFAGSGNSMIAYLNGTAGTPVTQSSNATAGSSPAVTVGGYRNDGSIQGQVNGRIAEAAIWNRVLAAWEFAALAKGMSPLVLRRGLVFWTPLVRVTNDRAGGLTMTGTTDGAIAHPPKVRRPRPKAFLFRDAGAPPAAATPRLTLLGVG